MGWFSDYLGLRRRPMIVSVLLSLAIILIMMGVGHLSFAFLIVLFLLLPAKKASRLRRRAVSVVIISTLYIIRNMTMFAISFFDK